MLAIIFTVLFIWAILMLALGFGAWCNRKHTRP